MAHDRSEWAMIEKKKKGRDGWHPIRWCRRIARRAIMVVLVALLTVGGGCYGSFPITHLVYSINGDIDRGLLRQVAFWVFIIIPVYEISALGDIIVMNVIEFWTGEDFGGFSARNGKLEVVMEPEGNGNTALMKVTRNGKTIRKARVRRVSDQLCEVHSLKGRLLARAVRTESGTVRFEKPDGEAVTTLSSSQLDNLMAESTAAR